MYANSNIHAHIWPKQVSVNWKRFAKWNNERKRRSPFDQIEMRIWWNSRRKHLSVILDVSSKTLFFPLCLYSRIESTWTASNVRRSKIYQQKSLCAERKRIANTQHFDLAIRKHTIASESTQFNSFSLGIRCGDECRARFH